jgi:CheY-like chemotaxis protein
LLSELKQEVVTATSGREALRHLLQREFAVILLDVRMPDMDGFETAALIRRRPSTEHTPIIFITSYGDATHASRGYSLGAVDYILAPVEPEVLKTKVLVFAGSSQDAQVPPGAHWAARNSCWADSSIAGHQLGALSDEMLPW